MKFDIQTIDNNTIKLIHFDEYRELECLIKFEDYSDYFADLNQFIAFLNYYLKNPNYFTIEQIEIQQGITLKIAEKQKTWRDIYQFEFCFIADNDNVNNIILNKKMNIILKDRLDMNSKIDKLQNQLTSLTTSMNTFGINTIQTVTIYDILDTDNSNTNYTGQVFNAYSSSCSNFEDLKSNDMTKGVGLNSSQGLIQINYSKAINNIILGGNSSISGGWSTSYWGYCTIICYNGYNIVKIFKLTQGNSNGAKFNRFPTSAITISKIIITGYCSFSKISFS